MVTMPSCLKGLPSFSGVNSLSITLVTVSREGDVKWHNGPPKEVRKSVLGEIATQVWLFATDPRTFEEMEDEVHGLLLRADAGSNVMSIRPVFYQGAPTMLVSLVRQYGEARVNLPSRGKFDNVATCVAEPLSATRGGPNNFRYGKKIWDWTDWSAEDLLWLLRYYGPVPNTFGIKLSPENNRQFLNLCMCLADEVVIIDTEESSYKNHLQTDDWSLMSYP